MGILSKLFRRKEIIEDPYGVPDYLYKNVWENKRQPSPGAQSFAYESLGLAQFAPSGPSVAVRQKMSVIQSIQPAVGQAVVLTGIPTTSGQVFGQQLYDPATGYSAPYPTTMNYPFPYSSEPDAGKIL